MKAITTQKPLATALVLAALLSGGGVTTNAHALSSSEIISAVTDNRLTDVSDEQITQYERHVTTDLMGNFVIRNDSNISSADKAILKQILTKSNKERQNAIANLPSHAKATGNKIQAAGGGIIFHWWGQTLWLDNLNSQRLSALLAGGAGVSGLIAFITAATGVGGVIAGGFASGFALASAASLICNWNQRGINIHRSYASAIPWCTPR